MQLTALMPIRSEGWIVGLSLRVALRWCDSVAVLLHSCTDNSPDIVADISREHPGRVIVLEADGESWDEMAHRQRLLEAARDHGATHVAIVDADEILTGNLIEPIRGIIAGMKAGHTLQLPGYNLRGSLDRYHASGIWSNRWFSTAFKDDARANWQGDTFHHREPFGFPNVPYRPIIHGNGGTLHLWGASERRLRAKHRAYRIQETLRWPDKSRSRIEEMYSWAERGTGKPGDTPVTWRFSAIPAGWWAPHESLMQHLHLEDEPWQAEWSDAMIAEHGRQRFAGLSI